MCTDMYKKALLELLEAELNFDRKQSNKFSFVLQKKKNAGKQVGLC